MSGRKNGSPANAPSPRTTSGLAGWPPTVSDVWAARFVVLPTGKVFLFPIKKR